MKYGVKGHLLNAGICELCKGDLVAINNALERYQELDPTFSGTRIFLLQLKKKMLDTLLPLSRNLITLAGGNAVWLTGNNNDDNKGSQNDSKRLASQIFALADTVALMSSLASVSIFFSTVISRFSEEDF
ncbi:hypothetical protein AHAS_Ahas20G0098200 [Arachis hypogaea]